MAVEQNKLRKKNILEPVVPKPLPLYATYETIKFVSLPDEQLSRKIFQPVRSSEGYRWHVTSKRL